MLSACFLSIQSQSMPPPNLPACHLCGRQFGTSSLAIHLKTCKEKWEREHNKPAPEPSAAIPTGAKVGSKEWAAFNAESEKTFEANMEACPHCNRTFLPDRLPIHLRTCGKGNFKNPVVRPRTGQGTPTEEQARQAADPYAAEAQRPKSAKGPLLPKRSPTKEGGLVSSLRSTVGGGGGPGGPGGAGGARGRGAGEQGRGREADGGRGAAWIRDVVAAALLTQTRAHPLLTAPSSHEEAHAQPAHQQANTAGDAAPTPTAGEAAEKKKGGAGEAAAAEGSAGGAAHEAADSLGFLTRAGGGLTRQDLAASLAESGLEGLLDVLWEGSQELRGAAKAKAEAEAKAEAKARAEAEAAAEAARAKAELEAKIRAAEAKAIADAEAAQKALQEATSAAATLGGGTDHPAQQSPSRPVLRRSMSRGSMAKERMQELVELCESGLITQDEFNAKRKAILDAL